MSKSDSLSAAESSVYEQPEESEETALGSLRQDQEWAEVVEQIASMLADGDLPAQVIRGAEYLMAGWPTYKVAKKLNTSPQNVRSWLVKYPAMAAVVSNGRRMLSKYRLSKLEQQFVQAIERSEEILDLPLSGEGVDPKVVASIGLHARFILGLFAGQKIDVDVHFDGDKPLMKGRPDAVDYVINQIIKNIEEKDVVEASFRVAHPDPKMDGPIVDENGNPRFGKHGELDQNEEGTQCHICGERFHTLRFHILQKHRMEVHQYEMTFMLPPGTVEAANE